MKAYDLIVIGGGLVGSAIAYGAARKGAQVAVLDEGDRAYRASRGNFGLVWVQGKGADMPAYSEWTRRSADLWPELQRELRERTGVDCCLEQPGGLMFCLSDQEMAERAAMNVRMHDLCGDNDSRMIGRDETKAMVPAIGPRVVGASYNRRDGHVSPLFTLRALHRGLLDLGGEYLPGRTVDAIDYDGGFNVRVGAETFRAAKLVVAAGLGSKRIAPMVGLEMPVEPVRGEVVVTERMRRFLEYPSHVIRQTPEGTVMMGDSHEEVGFDPSVVVPVVGGIAMRALAIFPGLADATVTRVWGALRVMTPDGHPIYDQSKTCPGAFSAACHSGVTLAGAHALALAPAILSGHLPGKFDAFSCARFSIPTA